MKLHIVTLSIFFGISPLLSSDYLTVEQQNEEMKRAFNKKETINPEQEILNSQLFQLAKQMFPHLASNAPSSVMTSNDWEQTEKYAAGIMFHRLNDALNFALTNREIILSAVLKEPELNGLTCYTSGQSELGELYFDFPLLSTPHPIASLAQGYLILKEHQYWIDILLLFKNTIFSQHTLSSYCPNAACAIKDLIQEQISQLEERTKVLPPKSVSLPQAIDQLDKHEISLFVNATHSFYDLLKGCLKSIHNALPEGTVTHINMNTAISIKNKGHLTDLGKNKRKVVFEKLSPQIAMLHAYFSNNYTAILTMIRSMAVMEYIMTNLTPEEVQNISQSPFYAAANNDNELILKGNWNYDTLFDSLKHNMISVEKIRKKLGLPKKIFKGLDFTKGMKETLRSYQLTRHETLTEGLQIQEEIEAGIEVKTETKAVEVFANNLIEPQDDQKTNQELTQIGSLTIHAPVLLPAIDKNTDNEEENFIFDGSYFKRIHQYHQNQKTQNTTGNLSKQNLSNYEIKLYSYLMDNIFRPQQRPTWDTLVSNLAAFGFKGKPNTSGNGSTWEFFVTEKNALFYMNPNYQGATFNVHEFKGNEPIHPRYLKFFQSGFSNVFELTEEYILKH
ncbi:MAG: hypothetical protein ACOH2E_02115 [Candidatus Paracaedibacter sp.]